MRFILFIILILLFDSCKINQKVNKQRDGFWIEKYKIGDDEYKSTGRYKKGEPIKKWKYFKNDTIYQKEKYKKNICKTIYYHKNANIMQLGQSKIEISNKEIHWFYFGDWFYFDENKKLIKIKQYQNGLVLKETNF